MSDQRKDRGFPLLLNPDQEFFGEPQQFALLGDSHARLEVVPNYPSLSHEDSLWVRSIFKKFQRWHKSGCPIFDGDLWEQIHFYLKNAEKVYLFCPSELHGIKVAKNLKLFGSFESRLRLLPETDRYFTEKIKPQQILNRLALLENYFEFLDYFSSYENVRFIPASPCWYSAILPNWLCTPKTSSLILSRYSKQAINLDLLNYPQSSKYKLEELSCFRDRMGHFSREGYRILLRILRLHG